MTKSRFLKKIELWSSVAVPYHFRMIYWVSIVSDSMSTVMGLSTMAAVSSFLTLRRTEQT